MTDIETPEAFAERLERVLDTEWSTNEAKALEEAVRSRDAAVRREALLATAAAVEDAASSFIPGVSADTHRLTQNMATATARMLRELAALATGDADD